MILALNPGSSSLKASLFDPSERLAHPVKTWNLAQAGGDSLSTNLTQILEEARSVGQIGAVGVRVVDAGPDLLEPSFVDESFMTKLSATVEQAPLHSKESLDLIVQVHKVITELPIVAVLDTAFHRTLPPIANTYALPPEIRDGLKVRRLGFHGLVYQSVVRSLRATWELPEKLVACQLGSGCSACAILNGESIDTTMGFTPLEGLIMGTRSGSIDPGIVLYLLTQGYDHDRLSDLLNHKSGISGLAGGRSNLKEVEALAKEGDSQAKFAIEMFTRSVVKHIASLAISMGGIDAVSFSGGIAEHSPFIRRSICEQIDLLGFKLDPDKNESVHDGAIADISGADTKPIWIIPAMEEREIAIQVSEMLKKRTA